MGIMTAARVRLCISAALFLGWLGWLAYLAITATNLIVLSRPQFLVADAWIIADLHGGDRPDKEVTVTDVIWSSGKSPGVGETISIPALSECGKEQHWQGAGGYILPLSSNGVGFKLVPIPQSPGFAERDKLLIYPLTLSTRRQVEQLERARSGKD